MFAWLNMLKMLCFFFTYLITLLEIVKIKTFAVKHTYMPFHSLIACLETRERQEMQVKEMKFIENNKRIAEKRKRT